LRELGVRGFSWKIDRNLHQVGYICPAENHKCLKHNLHCLICHKWPKDRRDRQFPRKDIAYYQKIVYVLGETTRLRGKVDALIESAGGWPIK
jgi:hypothetical protein